MTLSNRELFESLRRECDCWHEEFITVRVDEIDYSVCTCGNRSKLYSNDTCPCKNPNFTDPTWKDFGWAWVRAKEKDWWWVFILTHLYAGGTVVKQIDYDTLMYEDMVDPKTFIDRLKLFLVSTEFEQYKAGIRKIVTKNSKDRQA